MEPIVTHFGNVKAELRVASEMSPWFPNDPEEMIAPAGISLTKLHVGEDEHIDLTPEQALALLEWLKSQEVALQQAAAQPESEVQ